MKENTFNFYIYIYVSTVSWENMMSKDCIVDSENKILFEVTIKNICRGQFLSSHPWLALMTCGYMSLLALLNFLFDLSQGDSILLILSSQLFLKLNFLSVNNDTIRFCLSLDFLPFSVEFLQDRILSLTQTLFSPHARHT